jgi:hypothetical protein
MPSGAFMREENALLIRATGEVHAAAIRSNGTPWIESHRDRLVAATVRSDKTSSRQLTPNLSGWGHVLIEVPSRTSEWRTA